MCFRDNAAWQHNLIMSDASSYNQQFQSPNNYIMGEKKIVKSNDSDESASITTRRHITNKMKSHSMHVRKTDNELTPRERLARSEAMDLSKIMCDQESVSSSGRFLTPKSAKSAYRKVSVSSRVDLMLKNDLFRKHLGNHTELIKQHVKDKRFLLRKSVSDLNLTFKAVENLNLGEEGKPLEKGTSEDKFSADDSLENARLGTTVSSNDVSSSQNKHSGHLKPRQCMTRRHSMTAKEKSNLREFIEQNTPTNNTYSRQRFIVPSFSDFKKSRKKQESDEHSSSNARSVTPYPDSITSTCAKNSERGLSETVSDTEVPKTPVGYTGPIPQIVLQTIDEVTRTDRGLDDGIVFSSEHNEYKKDWENSSSCSSNELNLSSQSFSTVSSEDNVSDSSVLTCINTSLEFDPKDVHASDSGDVSQNFKRQVLQGKDCVDASEPDLDCSTFSNTSLTHNCKTMKLPRDGNFTSVLSDVKTYSRNLVKDVNMEQPSSESLSAKSNGAIQKQPSAMQTQGESIKVPVRSVSDVSSFTEDAHRKKRERRVRPYKSDPFTGVGQLPEGFPSSNRLQNSGSLDCFEFGKVDEVDDSLLEDSVLPKSPSLLSLEEIEDNDESSSNSILGKFCETEKKKRNRLSSVSLASYDSGVIGFDGSLDNQFSPDSSLSLNSSLLCTDSSQADFSTMELTFDSKTEKSPICENCAFYHVQKDSEDVLCKKCSKQRNERIETIKEIVETEISYGADLKILKEEFYNPLKSSGLMTTEQLESIFLNVDELIHVNKQFVTRVSKAIKDAESRGDLVYESVKMGELFLRSSTMFLAFENYVVNQPQAPELLEQLEKDKELLKIFLQVSQAENSLLRRMHLKSFLVAPVQRIMKYPLLLHRLFKATSYDHSDKSAIKEAEEKIEEILGNINSKAKFGSVRALKRKKSTRNINITEKMEVIKAALEVLGWDTREVCDSAFGKLNYTQTMDHLWAFKKGRNLKFSQAIAVLLTLGQADVLNNSSDNLQFSKKTEVKDAAMVLLKEKNGKYQSVREPFFLDKCVVFTDPDVEEVFELQEVSKETFVFKVSKGGFVFKADDHKDTLLWKQNLKQIIKDFGGWRRRRNAMPNIMIKTMR